MELKILLLLSSLTGSGCVFRVPRLTVAMELNAVDFLLLEFTTFEITNFI